MYYANMANYVKFIRGTQKAFEQLKINNSLDSNTLYFISDGSNLKLYLGSILINSSSITSDKEILSLTDLTDVDLQSIIKANSVLTYDDIKNQWVETPIEDLASLLNIPERHYDVMVGAVDDNKELGIKGKDGEIGYVPAPKKGQENFFLKGNGQWSDISGKIIEVSSPIIRQEIKEVIGGAPENFDTLKEVSSWILEHGQDALDLKNKVINLETKVGNLSKFNEKYTLVDHIDQLEQTISNDYVKKNDFITVVGKLNWDKKEFIDLKTENKNSLVEAINELHDQLIWGDINY